MTFLSPDFVEIKMDAEIGSYQEADEPTEGPLFVAADAEKALDPKD